MKNVKRILAVVLALALVFSFAACSNNGGGAQNTQTTEEAVTESPYKGEQINVAAISGPTGMGMVKLFSNSIYKMNLVTDPTTIPSLITSGEVDIAACPLNMASALYNKTNGGIRILGLNTLGVLYIVSSDSSVKSLNDLEGKTLYASGEGTTAQYILDYVLSSNGLSDKVTVEYLSEHSEVSTKLVSGDIQLAVLPEPFVSVATNGNKSVEAKISLTEEWEKINPDAKLAMGCVITTTKFIEKNKEAVEQFITDVKKSIEYVNVSPDEAINLIISTGILPSGVKSTEKKDADVKKATLSTIGRCNIVFIEGENMKSIADANFKVYSDANAQAIGGKVPASDIYYSVK